MNVFLTTFYPAILEALFWFSLTLVATLVAIYALSISLLGPAIVVARSAASRLRRSVASEITRLRSTISLGQGADAALRTAERGLQACRAELANAERASQGISLRHTVTYPAALLLVSGLSAKIALIVPAATGFAPWLFLCVLLSFGLGLFLLIRLLRTIRAIVELSVPDLEVAVDPDPGPWRVGQRHMCRIRAVLHRGNFLPRTQLVLFVPPSCEFGTHNPMWTASDDDPIMPGYRAIGTTVWDFRALAPFQWEFHHLEPRTRGPMTLYYAVLGESYTTEPRPVPINVE